MNHKKFDFWVFMLRCYIVLSVILVIGFILFDNTGFILLLLVLSPIAALLLSFIASIIVRIIEKEKKLRYEKKLCLVMESSDRCKYFINLSEKLQYEMLEKQYIYRRALRSKLQVDKINVDVQMIRLLDEEEEIPTLINREKTNQEKLKTYYQALAEVPPYQETKDKLYRKIEIEKSKELEEQAKPIIPEFIFIFYYSSPQGRNYYERKVVLSADELLQYYAKRSEVKNRKDMIQYERSIMTDSLRYDIMKRDGFKCVLCGATSADGVKLHVDHIRPVSKGGKTEPSNLRTLCERCNLGKRAKYDENGNN